MFSWADGFGHKHEGGACSIVFHRALPPGVFCIPLSILWVGGKESYEQADPGGNDESYEYVDEKEIDSRKKEERGKDDGDRLVGGKITNTRFTS